MTHLRLCGATQVLALLIVLGGCRESTPPVPLSLDGPPRWARQIVPHRPGWVAEREVPTVPQDSPQMVLWEVNAFPPDSATTPEQAQAARELVEASYRAALENGWYDFQKGLADGFQLMAEDRRHYENREYILDEHVLDPQRPEFLMYYGTPTGKHLAGFMFYTASALERGPQVGGPGTIWHFHVWKRPICMIRGLISTGLARDGHCVEGEPRHRSPEMIHVWLVDHPGGPFTTSMQIEPKLLAELLDQRGRDRPETLRR